MFPHESQGSASINDKQLMIVVWVGVGLSVLFAIFRYCIRWIFFRRLYLDDAFVFLALVILIASGVMYHFMAPTMYIMHCILNRGDPPPPNIGELSITFMKMQFAVTLLFWTGIWAVKFAFLAFFYQLGRGLRAQSILWKSVLVFSIMAYFGCLISYPIACSSFMPETCDSPENIKRALGSLRYSTIIDILTDIMIILLPVNIMWKVKINRKEKAALGIVFSLGGIIPIFALVRILRTNSRSKHPEPIWLALWSAIESSVAIIVSCLASFKTLFTRARDSRYANGTNASSNRRKNGSIPLVNQGQHHMVTVRGGSIHQPVSGDSSLLDEEIIRKERVHVKTDVEVIHSA